MAVFCIQRFDSSVLAIASGFCAYCFVVQAVNFAILSRLGYSIPKPYLLGVALAIGSLALGSFEMALLLRVLIICFTLLFYIAIADLGLLRIFKQVLNKKAIF